MKRISIFAIMVLLAGANITMGGIHYRSSWYPRLRWSMHAHGLVPNDLYYNPYAHGYGRTGLVPYWVRYSPYAHGIKNPSGLVNDYACSPSAINYYPSDIDFYRGSCRVGSNWSRTVNKSCTYSLSTKQARKNDLAKVKARREELHQLAQSRKQMRLANKNNGKEVIVAYLRDKNIDFRMNRMLSIEGKVLSADFTLGDGRMVISYWNPEEIQALDQQAEHKTRLYRNYVNSWKDFSLKHQQAGGKIFQIVSTDQEEVLAQLTQLDEFESAQTTYAMAQEGSSS
jgi:hypothetical protein